MADIKYEIVEEIGFLGMAQLPNMTSGSGHQIMKKWAKELPSQKKRLKS